MEFRLRAQLPRRAALIKLDSINEVINRTGITKTKAEMAVETVFESMKRALGKGERIELRGFGIFNVRPRKTGIGRNPRTGAEVAIPPAKRFVSSLARNCKRSSRTALVRKRLSPGADRIPASGNVRCAVGA